LLCSRIREAQFQRRRMYQTMQITSNHCSTETYQRETVTRSQERLENEKQQEVQDKKDQQQLEDNHVVHYKTVNNIERTQTLTINLTYFLNSSKFFPINLTQFQKMTNKILKT
jgi:hypothetical protein